MAIPNLDSVFAARFHGAANIRGIRYQTLYSLLRAFDLYAPGSDDSSIRLEGIEDVDLLGFLQDDRYVQVKSSQSSWNWAKLKDPIVNFLEVSRVAPDTRFVLAVDFELRTDIARLAKFDSLPSSDRARVRKKFRKLCRQAGGTTDEADAMLTRLKIDSIPEEQVWKQLQRSSVDAFGLGTEAVDTYLLVLVARFLEWAEKRKTVKRSDLDQVRRTIGEDLARESEFQAYGSGLLSRISWDADENLDDFLAGKATRPGHIAAGADVRREHWLETIAKSIARTGICIVRSSSGQGKSALLYRYAYENWPAEQTLVLRNADTAEQAELIRNYLQFRAGLGVPLLLLIDNAARQTRFWPLIVQQCAALNVHVLATVRTEDWYRFASRSLTNYEILEPDLQIGEARTIFAMLRAQGRIHPSVDSADWAYERIGEPHLLLEFTYLLTHGEMLEDRLRDQIRQFTVHDEDPAKIELLRRAALADSHGVPVSAEIVMRDLSLRDDAQQVLMSLEGEYVRLEGDHITGLHWVRSDHLTRILHEGYPSRSSTALAVLDAIPQEYVASFVAAAMRDDSAQPAALLDGFAAKSRDAPLSTLLSYLDGVFEGGEHRYFSSNKELFQEGYNEIGASAPFLMASAFMPVVKVDTLSEMSRILGDKGDNFRRLKEIASRGSDTPRGLSFATELLRRVTPALSPDALSSPSGEIGNLLDWCALCHVTIPAWSDARDTCISNELLELPLKSFCSFAQGVWRYDETTYVNWFNGHRRELTGFLMLHTDSILLSIDNDVASLEFFVASDGDPPHEQAMRRLNVVRAAVPFCERYQSEGIWCIPFGLVPSLDDTRKDIPGTSLFFESDIAKNVVWRMAVEAAFLPDSYYRFQQAWWRFRQSALQFIQAFSRGLQRTLAGKPFDFHAAFEQGALLVRVNESEKHIPDPPPQTSSDLAKTITGAPKRWLTSFSNCFRQTIEYIQSQRDNHDVGRLSVFNIKDATSKLPEMHAAFSELFREMPDYFEMVALAAEETHSYCDFADLLEAWILGPSRHYNTDPLKEIRKEATRQRRERIRKIEGSLDALREKGIDATLPGEIYVEHPLQHVILAFSVSDACYPERELEQVLQALFSVKDIVDFFCLIPLYRGATFLEGGYRISSNQLAQLEEGREVNWEALVPTSIPDHLLRSLPTFPIHRSARVQMRGVGFGIVGAVAALRERHNRIARLEASTIVFEHQLYERHSQQLKAEEAEVATAALRLLDDLDQNIPEDKRDSSFVSIRAFVQNVWKALTGGGIADLDAAFEDKAVEYIKNLEILTNELSELPTTQE